MPWLKELRTNANLTQKDISNKAYISESYYCLIEAGERNPSINVAKAIANVLNFDWTLFFPDDSQSA